MSWPEWLSLVNTKVEVAALPSAPVLLRMLLSFLSSRRDCCIDRRNGAFQDDNR